MYLVLIPGTDASATPAGLVEAHSECHYILWIVVRDRNKFVSTEEIKDICTVAVRVQVGLFLCLFFGIFRPLLLRA